jgi:purine-binding chemotaxis protein CheW
MTEELMEAPSALELQGGLHLTFQLDEEVYGINILKVQEIIGIMSITSVPQTPEWVRGVINLRGKVIPVIDLRLKFGMPFHEDTEKSCVIVVQIALEADEITTGLIVDQVSEVLDISPDQLEPPPAFGGDVDTGFILGMGKVAEQVVMLLDVDKILAGGELQLLDPALQDA